MRETCSKPTLSDTNTGFCSKPTEIRTHSPTEVRFHWIPLLTRSGSCETHRQQMEQNSGLLQQDLQEICYQYKDSYVHHWITSICGENSKTGQDPHETFSVASQSSLEIPSLSDFSHSLDSENEMTWGMVVKPAKKPKWRIRRSQGSRRLNLYRRLKRRLGRTLRP